VITFVELLLVQFLMYLGVKTWLGGSKVTFENSNFTLFITITMCHLTNYVTQYAIPMLMVKILVDYFINIYKHKFGQKSHMK
jgi:hypothetical protein